MRVCKSEVEISLERLYVAMSPQENAWKYRKQFVHKHLPVADSYKEMIILTNLLTEPSGETEDVNALNIYENSSPHWVIKLTCPHLCGILRVVSMVLEAYPSHPISSIATLCSKIY